MTLHTCMHTCPCTNTCMHTHTCTHTHAHTHAHMHVYLSTHICARAHTHTHTHTHTHYAHALFPPCSSFHLFSHPLLLIQSNVVSVILKYVMFVCCTGKIEMVKSQIGLAVSAVVTVVSSLFMSLSLCFFFGLNPTLNGR